MSVRQRLVYQMLVILHSSIYEGAILQTFLYLHKFERSNKPIDIHKKSSIITDGLWRKYVSL